jgi:fermentation-respiration switch protein FrsA (DUF1100 family)
MTTSSTIVPSAEPISRWRRVSSHESRSATAAIAQASPALGLHEVPFDEAGIIVRVQRILPEKLPANLDPVLAAFFDYYRTPRGFHPRGINSATAWTATTPKALIASRGTAHDKRLVR